MKKMNLVKLMAAAFVVMSIASSAFANEGKDVKKPKHEFRHKKHAAATPAVPAVPAKKS